MNEEDIKDNLRKMLFNTTQANSCGLSNNDFIEEIRTLSSTLDLLDKKDKELDKKDKVIDIAVKQIEKQKEMIDSLTEGEEDCFIPNTYSNIDDCVKKKTCADCIKEYFYKKVEEKNE